ncbi:MAG: efflux RND transporter periplasmic adaptor subunit [Candidatus Zixiibacteriota bacterium]
MKKKVLMVTPLLLITQIFSGCGSSDSEARNMEQLYAKQGVPVVVRELEYTSFSKYYEANADLSGLEESSAYAAISDKIDKINYKVGDYVNKDDVVLTFPTDNPAAKYYQAKVSYENAHATYDRMKSYFETGGLSRQDFDNARTQYEVARADWDAVQQSVLVRAPISGILTKIDVRESDNVEKDDELFTVARNDRMKARLWISDKQICTFKVGLPAVAEWNNISVTGRVAQVDMSMNKARQAFGVVVEFDNPENHIRCGITARVKVATYRNPEAIVINRADILKENRQNYVYVVSGDKCERRDITPGEEYGVRVEVIDGLKPGDTLIVEGQLHLEPGVKIMVKGNDDLSIAEPNGALEDEDKDMFYTAALNIIEKG